jgi:ADP-ribose pyrophosphatase YjhB (NUDIX family)
VKSVLARLFRAIPLPIARAIVGFLHARFNVTVAGVFFTPDGRVLILKHVFRHRHPWGLPAGFLDAGEVPEVAMAREVKEEIGLEVKVDRVFTVHLIRPRHMEVVVRGAVDPKQVLRPNHEIFEGAFVFPDALPADMMPSQAEIVRRAVAASPSLRTEA